MVTKLVVVKVVVSLLYVRREGRKATPQATFSEALKVMKYKGVWQLLGLRKKLSPIHKCYYFIHEYHSNFEVTKIRQNTTTDLHCLARKITKVHIFSVKSCIRKWKMRLFELISTQRAVCSSKNVIETGSLCKMFIPFFSSSSQGCLLFYACIDFAVGFLFLPSFVTHVRYNKKQVPGLQRYVRAFLSPLTNGLLSFSIPYILF